MSDNSLYQLGEWPQIGLKVEAMVLAENIGKRYEKGAVINYVRTPHNYKAALFSSELGELFIIQEKSDFRPIKTERELAIEAVIDIYHNNEDIGQIDEVKELAKALFDAGLLRSKNES